MRTNCHVVKLTLAVLSIGLVFVVAGARAEDDYRGGSLEARTYRDGVNAGLKDFKEHRSYRPQEHAAWKDADRGYDEAFGSKDITNGLIAPGTKWAIAKASDYSGNRPGRHSCS